jgi:hypothetical protein
VRTLVDARLRDEAERFSFRFACDDCVHFDERGGEGTGGCSLLYPAAPRRTALGHEHLELCKEFELGT